MTVVYGCSLAVAHLDLSVGTVIFKRTYEHYYSRVNLRDVFYFCRTYMTFLAGAL